MSHHKEVAQGHKERPAQRGIDANEEAELDATPPIGLGKWTIEDQIKRIEVAIDEMRPLDEHELDGAEVSDTLEDMLELIVMLRKER